MTGPSAENGSAMTPTPKAVEELANRIFKETRVPSFIHVNLDAVAHNVDVIRRLSGPNTELMGVVKGSAYGSGILPVVEVLLEKGAKELAVATMSEGIYLRKNDVTVPILVLGNLIEDEVVDILQYNLIPSLSWDKALRGFQKGDLCYPDGRRLQVTLNIDTGMSRYGVQPEDLAELVEFLDDLEVEIHSMYTHFQSSITEVNLNRKQLEKFLAATKPYEGRPFYRHAAATTGLVQGLGADLDFVRPGGAITGLCSGSDAEDAKQFESCGFRPALSVVTRPAFYKLLSAGRRIGYDGIYETTEPEWIVNLTTGWSDGCARKLSNQGAVKRIRTGEKCPIVGRVSMDSITIKLPDAPHSDEVFQLVTDDFDDTTSAIGVARRLGAAVYEITGNWSTRLPRVYTKGGEVVKVFRSLEYTN
ncbi:alanine racemase-like [Oratosquilla oratoria]|uniref:alanine racemase-like n=1 Tax=Oratosquilla oratoria TaxID=337810 RepID=UPI003F76E570